MVPTLILHKQQTLKKQYMSSMIKNMTKKPTIKRTDKLDLNKESEEVYWIVPTTIAANVLYYAARDTKVVGVITRGHIGFMAYLLDKKGERVFVGWYTLEEKAKSVLASVIVKGLSFLYNS